MDPQKLDEAIEKIKPTEKHRDPHDRMEIEVALQSWSGSIQAMLDGRFGKQKVIHLLVLAPVGNEAILSWISTASFPSVRAMISALQERMRYLEESRITIPQEHFGG